ncbi:MAG TPA: hypothetical protein VL633_09870, partial [Bacteroidota bacterium]|nr:hypothetical protein [Bacteroidota bacterium]
VATLLDNQLMEDGTDEVEFDASNMSSGVYFYRLIAQGIGDPDEGTVGQYLISTKKMLLVK